MGFNDIIIKLFGNKSQRDLKEIKPYVAKIKEAYTKIDALSHNELRALTVQLRGRINERVTQERAEIEKIKADIESKELNEREEAWKKVDNLEKDILDKIEVVLEEILPEAFAIVKSTARRFAENSEIRVDATQLDRDLSVNHDFVRVEGDTAIYQNHWMAGGNEITWDMVHYDVQLFGGTVLHKGKIAEMATGEGKTLVATLPVFLNALPGNGVHVVTVNDYLSKRDSEWMGPLYMFHGLTVDCIDKHQPNSDDRRKAYNADITFGTNNEFGFDYLRDNMAMSASDLVQRKHNYAIVDEVDSVLIDDARTPLIISGPTPKGDDQLFEEFLPNVEKVVNAQRKLCAQLLIDAKQKMSSSEKNIQEEGSLLLYRSFKGMPKNKQLIKYLSEQGIKSSMLKTEEQYMAENMRNMHIVTDPLYFVIDEKNNSIELTDKGIDLLTSGTDDPSFFILPDIASELAELENMGYDSTQLAEHRDELLSNYSIKSERVHTVNQLLKAYSLFEKDDQYVVMDNKVMIVDEQTGRIMDGRRYSDGLHQAIEAKERVKVEAATQTFATITLQNYFRMYHKLSGMTGTAETEAGELWDIYKLDVVVIPTNRPIARNDMNDRIYKTAREKYAAVIEEIQTLISDGRPVLVGTTNVETSELLSRMLKLRGIEHNVLNAKLHQKEADIVAQAGKTGTVTIATNMAGRGTDIKLSPEVRDAGGLAIIGTERHESRRVDRQLRGRAGRQGDPGSSVFFISLEDHLMRLFATDRIASLMDKLGFKEGEVLENNMLSRSVERAQKKVEENNFGIRKRLLEYDDVMNTQREVIYTKRKHALMGERVGMDVLNTLYDTSKLIAETYAGSDDFQEFKTDLMITLAIESPLSEEKFRKEKAENLTDIIFDAVYHAYSRKMDMIAEIAYPVLHRVFEEQGNVYERIVIPVTDGKRMYNIPCNLKEADESKGKSIIKEFQKAIVLLSIDEAWKEHLREMDELRHSVQNASYENKDPLLIYKLESYELFRKMLEQMNRRLVSILMRARIPMPEPSAEEQERIAIKQAEEIQSRQNKTKYREIKDDIAEHEHAQREASSSAGQQPQHREPIRVENKVGRNDLCPCGSGKKYKNCHGKN
ncbi:preprotein translocase subunit SecA [Porphyromonas crevioricanis]|uniref:Protein translocase subunit SecA n=2 Tax=Porphyromonas crevioricanis TaxID=393921 RepID=A0A0A2G2F0_9PORP|nr:preprotein translocase subunit SecA [Porphyromonas crevioricanis]KGN91068.1 preprotein translocase subunit SecA [Porphyromonas crevioricanis]KGN94664.1 preprotein translocase subunit SecA [Porphyromonas crevioricanis]SJZ57604.1 preprotein translocase subunit SecA [Porphyromonas crevioricanis]SQH73422.1 preprotein translocase subunit SecA [Porphyromonas crevioricanis]GAD06125.1 protein export cytoplasm protein SecA ATPase RNA helicase [Porphyromonas crevioricanis JCM 15906]